MVRPHVAVVTTVEPVHLEYFGSVEDIADAKAEIFAGLEPGGAAVHQPRQPAFRRCCAEPRAARRRGASSRFGEHEDADVRLTSLIARARRARIVEATIARQRVTYRVGAPGRAHRA